MKFCKDCEYMEMQAVPLEDGRLTRMPVCKHDEVRHPVFGTPIVCQQARQETVFCGFTAKYWLKKIEDKEAPVVALINS